MKSNTPQILQDLTTFIEYCNDFYNIHHGIFKIATEEEIEDAVYQYMTQPTNIEILFDTTDRERVREILQPELKTL